ncbi:MAG: Rieske 2Fe-2S domain-containing protein [bacterium]|nr:Rieske 2Fe-2S domain-containing protein [bacterium]
MGHTYQAVGWNRQKKIYDRTLVLGVVLYLGLFIGLGLALQPAAALETLLIRGVGTAAFVLLHVVLAIGPLCRLDRRFLPLLYNRRHMGVVMFLLALLHGGFSTAYFHALGDANPIVSMLSANPRFGSLSQFPFQPLGAAALVILFLMAATSHDFWLANLTAPVWKALHMLVYPAYALVVMHVALGTLQAETNPLMGGAVGMGLFAILGLHVAVGRRESASDVPLKKDADGWVDVCAPDDIPEKRAVIATVAGDRVAVFRHDGKISAVSNACQHQNGPLGEGCIQDGLIVCPWHGYQYDPTCGRSPEPFTERIPTFAVRIEDGRVQVEAKPRRAGTAIEPARVVASREGGEL